MSHQAKDKARSTSFTWDYHGTNNNPSSLNSTQSLDDTESDPGESLLDGEWQSLHHVVQCDGMSKWFILTLA